MTKIFCNFCSKEFDEYDIQEGFGFHCDGIGYGSQYDGCSIGLDLCCECFDKVMNCLEPQCKYNPIIADNLRLRGELD